MKQTNKKSNQQLDASQAERDGRAMDKETEDSFEKLRSQGYM